MMKVIEKYWQSFSKKKQINEVMPAAWMFGDGSKAMGDELGALVITGKKLPPLRLFYCIRMNQFLKWDNTILY